MSKPERNFEVLWKTFHKGYPFFELRDVDWNEQYRAYRPRVNSKASDDELFRILCQMLDPLNDGHVELEARVRDEKRHFNPEKKPRFWQEFTKRSGPRISTRAGARTDAAGPSVATPRGRRPLRSTPSISSFWLTAPAAVRTAVREGVSYHSSAGNDAQQHLEQDFVATPSSTLHDFAGGTGDNTETVSFSSTRT